MFNFDVKYNTGGRLIATLGDLTVVKVSYNDYLYIAVVDVDNKEVLQENSLDLMWHFYNV
jgi:hypothetical protein